MPGFAHDKESDYTKILKDYNKQQVGRIYSKQIKTKLTNQEAEKIVNDQIEKQMVSKALSEQQQVAKEAKKAYLLKK